jgi:predicted RNase H-like nuclease (RuvC/YqgF family)
LSAKEINKLREEIQQLKYLNESLRREVRTQRQEIAALREERRSFLNADRPMQNEFPEGGWIS